MVHTAPAKVAHHSQGRTKLIPALEQRGSWFHSPIEAGIADPRILSWWTQTDLRTDSLQQPDTALGLAWCS